MSAPRCGMTLTYRLVATDSLLKRASRTTRRFSGHGHCCPTTTVCAQVAGTAVGARLSGAAEQHGIAVPGLIGVSFSAAFSAFARSSDSSYPWQQCCRARLSSWRQKGDTPQASDLRFRSPQTDHRKSPVVNDLRDGGNSLVAHWQRARGEDCPESAPADSDDTLFVIQEAWPRLPEHIRRTVLTLVAAGLRESSEGGSHVR